MDLIRIDKRTCKNILENGEQCKTLAFKQEKYNGYCYDCYYIKFPEKIPIKNIKVKEKDVVIFIKSNYDTKEIREKYKIIDIRYDKVCGNTKKSPDIVFIYKNYG